MGVGDKRTRRGVLAGSAAAGLMLVLPIGAEAAGLSPDVPRKLLRHASERAVAKLTQPDGFCDSPVARFELPELFTRGATAVPVENREQLQRRLNAAAAAGARRAGHVLRGANGQIKNSDAAGLIRGLPTSTTSHVRSRLGPKMINEMIPAIERALRSETDPVVVAAFGKLEGIALREVAQAIANKAESAVWYQVGAEEAEIRKDPTSTRDRTLIRAFGPK